VAAVPEYAEKTSAPAYYQPGTADGSRPGRLFIDTYNATERNLYGVESIAYHEGIPGHHLQISIAHELTGTCPSSANTKATRLTPRAGGSTPSGWARMWVLPGPYSDYGRLEADIWRAIRLVVDTGVHSQAGPASRWSIISTTTRAWTRPACRPKWTAILRGPSQALAYKIGQLKILELRDKAKKALGPSSTFAPSTTRCWTRALAAGRTGAAHRRVDCVSRKRLDVEMRRYRRAGMDKNPTNALLRAVRRVLRVPVAEIAEKMGVCKSVVLDLEAREVKNTVTLRSMSRMAQAMGCKVVYGIVPEGGKTLEELAEYRLWAAARELGIIE
jgi:transcriptional regulator with XRE-family HTH domain